MIAQTNAHLVKVEAVGGTVGSGFSEDYDAPATDPEGAGGEGADLWVGRREAYWIERRQRITTGQESRLVLQRSLLIDPQLPEVDFANGQTVHVEHAGEVKTGKIATIERRQIPGLQPSIRLTMEDA